VGKEIKNTEHGGWKGENKLEGRMKRGHPKLITDERKEYCTLSR
jgi:hypothetical protein